MNKHPKNDTARILGAIIAGCIAVAAAGAALLPLLYVVFDNFLVFDFREQSSGGGSFVIIAIACLAWLFISMMCGGYVAARIALGKEYHITWTIIGIGILILIFYGLRVFDMADVLRIVISGTTGILGALAGCHSGIQYKQRKKKEAAILSKQRDDP